MNLRDELVVVSGDSSGIGAATARALGKRGARVALLARRKAKLEEVAAEVVAAGGEAHIFPVDLSDAAAATEVVAPPSLWRTVRQGFFTNALNPKVALFFLALLPQFIAADAPDKTLAFLFLGGWFIVQGLLFLLALIALVAPLRRARPRPWVGRSLNLGGAGLFTVLAAKLALTKP